MAAYKKFFLIASSVIFIFSVVIASFSLTKPFNLDEADFASAAHGIITKGIPVMDIDELYFERYKWEPLGLWHPPLYIHALAAFFKILGETELAGRGMGYICYLITYIFLILILKELFSDKEFYITSFIASLFYFINPMLIQYSMLIDIDGGMLAAGLSVFAYFFIRFNKHDITLKNIILLGVIFGATLLIKFTTPPLMIPAIFLFYLLKRKPKEAFLAPLLILATGAIVSWSIWYIYCKAAHMPLFFPIQFTFETKWNQGGLFLTKEKIAHIRSSVLFSLYWLSFYFMLLMFFSALNRISAIAKKKAIENMDFLLILGIIIWLFYFYYFPRSAMMKYQTVLYPFFIIIMSNFIYTRLFKNSVYRTKDIVLGCALILAGIAYYYFFFPDMVLWYRARFTVLVKGSFYPINMLYYSPFIVISIAFYFMGTKKHILHSALISLALLTVSSQITEDLKQVQKYTTANSWFNYGESGQKEATAYLNKALPADGVIIARKDIAYYLKSNPMGSGSRKWIANEIFSMLGPKQAEEILKSLMENYDIQYVQLDSVYGEGYDTIKPYFTFDKKFDDFVVFKKR